MQPLPKIPGYELLTRLGGGVLTSVYAARDLSDDTACAVKVIREDWEDQPTAIKLLQREARACLAVRHAHLVRLLKAHVTRPPYFLVMEQLPGESLRRRLRRDYRLDAPTALWITRQTAEALAALHRAGFVHGDVKPENIRLIDPGTAILVDLGFAHRPGADLDLGDDYVLGTANYLAPELCRAATADGFAADWYSFGVTTLEMLTGRLPGRALTPAEILAAVADAWPTRLLALVDSLLAERPDDRPPGPLVLHELIALEIAALGRVG